MRVLITGGTGFVGSHTVRAVSAAGHDVRLLVRSPARVAPALEPLEVDPPEHHVGDATDPDAVRAALDGCDAVIHCAAIFSLDPRDAARMAETNRRATEVVLSEALERGCEPVVYCSTLVSLLPMRTPQVTAETPVGDARVPYVRSKADAEHLVRDLQASGASVISVLPGAVTGPHDPYLGETNENWIRRPLRGILPFSIRRGVNALVDVREVAAVLAACLTSGNGRTYVVGRLLGWNDAFVMLRRLTGRRLPQLPTPGLVARGGGILFSALARTGLPVPFTNESVSILLLEWAPVDESAVRSDLGVEEVPLETSFADTIRWMVAAGHLRPAQAGALG